MESDLITLRDFTFRKQDFHSCGIGLENPVIRMEGSKKVLAHPQGPQLYLTIRLLVPVAGSFQVKISDPDAELVVGLYGRVLSGLGQEAGVVESSLQQVRRQFLPSPAKQE